MEEVKEAILQNTINNLKNTIGTLHVGLAESQAKCAVMEQMLKQAQQELDDLKAAEKPKKSNKS